MAAIGIDGDSGMYRISYFVVDFQCTATRSWFLEYLTEDLEIASSHTITWITNKQKGLVEAVLTDFPNVEHRFCVKHLYNNFKVEYKGL